MTKLRSDLGWTLSVLRMAVGAATWLAPGAAARVLGEQRTGATSLPFVLRLFGVRDFTMGLGYLQASPEQQHRLLLVGMYADSADAAAALIAQRRGQLPARLAVPFALSAAAAVAAAVVARRQ